MDIFEPFQVFFKDIIFTLGELAALSLLFLILYIVIKILFRKVDYVPFLSKYKEYSTIILKKIKRFLIFFYTFLLISLLSYNGYLIYRNIGVYQNAVDLLSRIPSEFWIKLLLGLLKIILVSIAAHYFIKLSSKILDRAEVKAKAYKNLRSNNETIESFFPGYARL